MSSVISRLGKIFKSPNTEGVGKKPNEPTTPKQPIVDYQIISSIIASLKEGVTILDNTGTVILSNQEMQKLTNFTQTELVGKVFFSTVSFTSKDGKKVEIEEPPRSQKQLTLHGQDGFQSNVNLDYTSINDAGRIVVLQNISEKASLEEMQVDFVSMASHELRTPLTSIVNYLSVLEEEAKGKLDKEQQEFLDRSLNATKQLLLLVENILSVSKVERGATALNIKSTDWGTLLNQAVKELRMQAIEKNIELSLNLPKQLPPVVADSLRITEVVNNLISNAIKHTKSGGTIKVKTEIIKGEIVTRVEDNGEGIASEALPHLFTKFYRTPGSLQKGDQGTGLGLYISKSIIDLHHGRIWAESKPGKGAIFSFSLPVESEVGPSVADLLK